MRHATGTALLVIVALVGNASYAHAYTTKDVVNVGYTLCQDQVWSSTLGRNVDSDSAYWYCIPAAPVPPLSGVWGNIAHQSFYRDGTSSPKKPSWSQISGGNVLRQDAGIAVGMRVRTESDFFSGTKTTVCAWLEKRFFNTTFTPTPTGITLPPETTGCQSVTQGGFNPFDFSSFKNFFESMVRQFKTLASMLPSEITQLNTLIDRLPSQLRPKDLVIMAELPTGLIATTPTATQSIVTAKLNQRAVTRPTRTVTTSLVGALNQVGDAGATSYAVPVAGCDPRFRPLCVAAVWYVPTTVSWQKPRTSY